jgi:hypothetical protein
MMNKLDDALQLDRIANAIADEIADQFTIGFCNDRMVEGFAEVVKNHINALRLEQEAKDTELRDHFAGLAMQTLPKNIPEMETLARMSYVMADAMIAERNKHHKERHETFGEGQN